MVRGATVAAVLHFLLLLCSIGGGNPHTCTGDIVACRRRNGIGERKYELLHGHPRVQPTIGVSVNVTYNDEILAQCF